MSPEDRGLTRRSLLQGAVAGGVASLVSPGAVIAAPVGEVFNAWVGSLPGGGTPVTIDVGHRFALVGVEWDGPEDARIELRTRARGGPWSPWAVASVLGHEPDRRAAGGARFGEPVWSGRADQLQLRSSRHVGGVRAHFVAAPSPAAAVDAAGLPLASPVLHAGSGQPPIIARHAWAGGQARPAGAAEYGTVKLAFVHHTQSTNGYSRGEVPAMLLSIFQYHRFVRGFPDIAYNFIIDAFGGIWEARAGGIDAAVVGAQAGGYNQQSTGVAVLGSFIDFAPPPAAIDALERLLAWKLSLHGVPAHGRVTVVVAAYDYFYTPFPPDARVSLPRVAGHRDGDLTDCPGDAFYARLPAIRPRVVALARTPARVTLSLGQRTATAGEPFIVRGRLSKLSGQRIARAPIEVQHVIGARRRTIARSKTSPDGSWQVALELSRNIEVRALHRPAPATVSDPVRIGVAPAIKMGVQGSRMSGTVWPAKRGVTVEVFAPRGGRRHLVARERVAVRRGAFSGRLPVRSPGSYTAIASTGADARNIAGRSAAVDFSL